MQIPKRIPGLKWLLIFGGIYGFIWIALEGNLQRVVLMGFMTTAITLLFLIQKFIGDKPISTFQWIALTAVAGACLGLGTSLLTLLFMAIKTGLHGHGPEFSLDELTWVSQQLLLWTAVGFLGGTGLGLITSQLTNNQ